MAELPTIQTRTVAQYFNNVNTQEYLKSMLNERTGQFITSCVSLANTTYGLTNVEPKSLLFCGLKATSLNLPLDNNLGFAYAIPYKNKKLNCTEAQFQMGYKGFVQLAQRTGQYKNINVIDVREGELVKWDSFTEELELNLIPDPEAREKAPIIGYAGYFELVNGFRKVSYWQKPKVERHGKRYSKSFADSYSPWQTDFDAMAKKTVLKNLLSKWGPLSTEMQEAIQADQSVIRGERDSEYIDVPDFTPATPEDTLSSEFNAEASLALDAKLASEEGLFNGKK